MKPPENFRVKPDFPRIRKENMRGYRALMGFEEEKKGMKYFPGIVQHFPMKGLLNEPLGGHVIEFADGHVEGYVTDPNTQDPNTPIYEIDLPILLDATWALENSFLSWASDAFTS